MKINWPKLNYLPTRPRQFLYISMGLGSGYFIYLYFESISIGILLGFIVFILVPYLHSHIDDVEFRKHISKYGEPFGINRNMAADYAGLGIEDNAVIGGVPFNGDIFHCTTRVNDEGVIVSSGHINRLLPWQEIKYIKHLMFLSQPIIELSIHDLNTVNRLIIPWDKNLSESIPENIQQYYS